MKTTLDIEPDLHRRAKAHAAMNGQSMKEMVDAGLRKVLETAADGNERMGKEGGESFVVREAVWGEQAKDPQKEVSSAALLGLMSCFREADLALLAAEPGPQTGLEILEKDRQNLGTWEEN